ncbi:PulJ/GspJ family protein [Thermus brockianus]
MRKGFTLLEILVALAVLGIFTALLLAFTQGTLASNRTARLQAQLLEELKDAAGYLADNLQEAQTLLASATLNGNTCAPPGCLAALVPEAPGGSCALRAYKLEARSAIPDDYKAKDPWADANTRMLREYRLSGLSCAATAYSNAQPYVVLDLVDNDPTLPFFQLSPSPLSVTLNIRLKAKDGSRVIYVPSSTQTYTLRVYPRNAP